MKRIGLAVLAVLLLSVLVLCQEAVNLGSIPVGTTVTATYTFRNSNPFSCTLESVGFGENFFQTSGPFAIQGLELPQSVPAGGTIHWTVSFRPAAVVSYREEMKIKVRCGIFSQMLTAVVYGQGAGTGGETSDTGPITDTVPITIDITPPGTVASEGCECTTEIAQLASSLNALTFVVQGDLSTTVRRISEDVGQIQTELVALQLVSQEPIALDDVCPGPFPTQGGKRFFDFVAAQRRLVVQAAQVLPAIDAEVPSQQAVLDAGGRVLLDLTLELDQVTQLVTQLPTSQQQCFDSYVPLGATPYLDSVYNAASDPANHPKLKALMSDSGMDVAGTVWNKLKIWVGYIPGIGGVLEGLMNDIDELTTSGGDALAVAGMLFQYELEKKLDGIIKGVFGIEIPLTATETQLQELLRLIPDDSLIDRLGRIESGVGANAARLAGLESEIELLKTKLDSLASQLGVAIRGVRFEVEPDLPKPEYSGPDYGRGSVLDSIELLRLKLDNLGRILGLSLYGPEMGFPDGFDIEPPDPHSTSPTGAGPEYDAIKPEIKALEEALREIRESIERLVPGDGPLPGDGEPPHNGNGNGNGGPPAPNDEYINRQLALTKKIYVYDEGVLRAADADDTRVIVVTTAAFDLAGWVDLTDLRDGDEVMITVEISVAGGPFRLWSTGVFQGVQSRGLKYFTEFSDGLQEVVGTDVRLTIAQTESADGYATPVEIYYQFIVESQD